MLDSDEEEEGVESQPQQRNNDSSLIPAKDFGVTQFEDSQRRKEPATSDDESAVQHVLNEQVPRGNSQPIEHAPENPTAPVFSPSGNDEQANGQLLEVPSPSSSAAELLQSQLEFGLRTVTELLHDTNRDYSSLTSSQLSSPLSSPRSTQLDPFSQTSPIGHTNKFDAHPPPITDLAEINLPGPTQIPTYQGRPLRQRNPIQQNPYTLEAAHYQLSLKARGLKPVKVVTEEHKRQEESRQELLSSQYKFPSSPPNCRRLSSSPAAANETQQSYHMGEWLVGKHDKNRGPVHKRRRLMLPNQPKNPSFRRDYDSIFDFPDEGGHDHEEIQGDEDGIMTFNEDDVLMTDIFHSPSISQLTPPVVAPENELGFRVPRGASPLEDLLPKERLQINKSPAEVVDIRSSGGSSQGDDEGLESSREAGDANTNQVERYQRRIKGVLPASWLRLDRLKQSTPAKARLDHLRTSPSKTMDAKGVAQKVRRSRANPIEFHQTYSELLSDDLSDTDSTTTKSPRLRDQQDLQLDPFELMDDLPVEDYVDDMAPPTRRFDVSTEQISCRLMQPRITSLARGEKNKVSHSFQDRSLKRKNISSRTRDPLPSRPRSARPPPSVVGILDAQDVTAYSRNRQPQFLKIAARQARSRKDHARRKPTSKIIQLSNARDTADANEVLTQWKRGRVDRAPRKYRNQQLSSRNRPPLQELPINEQSATFNSPDQYVQRGHNALHPMNSSAAHTGSPSTHNDKVTTQDGTGPSLINKQQTSKTFSIRPRPGACSVISTLHRSRPRNVQVEVANQSDYKRLSPTRLKTTADSLNWGTSRKALAKQHEESFGVRETRAACSTDESPNASNTETPKPKKLPRRPKKSMPKQLIHSKRDEDQTSMTSLRPRQTSIRHFVGCIPRYSMDFGLSPLPSHIRLDGKSFVGSGKLALVLGEHRTDSWPVTPLLVARTGRQQEVKRLYSKLSTLVAHLAPVLSSSRFKHPTEPNDHLSSIIVCLENIMQLFLDNNSLPELAPKAEQIPSLSLQAAESFESAWKTSDQVSSDVAIELLIRLTLIAYCGYGVCLNHCPDVSLAKITTEYEKILNLLASTIVHDECLSSLHLLLTNTLDSDVTSIDTSQYPQLDAIIVLNHLLEHSPLPTRWACFWDFYNHVVRHAAGTQESMKGLEIRWKTLFVVSTTIQFTTNGQIRQSPIPDQKRTNWAEVKELFRQAHTLSAGASSHIRTPPFYTRSAFQRCLVLAQRYRWDAHEIIIDTLYDLFRRSGLHNPTEEHYEYPAFLDNLTPQTVFYPSSEDGSFHSMIKLIAITLKDMAQRSHTDPSQKRQMKNLLFRLVPNNGQVSSKYDEVAEHSLTPLKNHYDLLTVLYWAAPTQFRPRLQRFEDLVDFSGSHLSACRVSLQTWKRLVYFQITALEPLSSLIPFAVMLDSMMKAMVHQHRDVANEVYAQRAGWSDEHVTSIIKYNKCQLERFLLELLEILTDIIKVCQQDEQAITLVSRESISSILCLFPSRSTQCDKLFLQTFSLVTAFAERNVLSLGKSKGITDSQAVAVQNTAEDSQEYGDWSHLDALIDEPQSRALEYVNSAFFPSLFRLVCDAIGADEAPAPANMEDLLLSWSSIIQILSTHGLHYAGNFLSSQHHESWDWLRNTDQKHCYRPFFVSCLVEKLSITFYEENRSAILDTYIKMLAEPRRFHTWLPRLTEAICKKNEPIMQTSSNLILQYLNPKRILAIIMINMRISQKSRQNPAMSRDLMVTLLRTMKENYKELDRGNDYNLRDEYVAFVHGVLDQVSIYLPTYRKLDPFFNDVSLFPQSAGSIYISLRQYSLGLPTSANQKSLVTFVYNILERAALEDSQESVQEQFVNALDDSNINATNTGYHSDALRQFLLEHVLPAYVEVMFHDHGWSLVQPVFFLLRHIYETSLLPCTSVCVEDGSVEGLKEQLLTEQMQNLGDPARFLETTIAILTSFHTTLLVHLRRFDGLPLRPQDVDNLSTSIVVLTSMIPPIDYLVRDGSSSSDTCEGLLYQVLELLSRLNSQFSLLMKRIVYPQDELAEVVEDDRNGPLPETPILEFARSEVNSALETSWSIIPGRGLCLTKHNSVRAVLSASRLKSNLEKEILAVGSVDAWTRWTIWAACEKWNKAWEFVQKRRYGSLAIASVGERPESRLGIDNEPSGLVTSEDWRLFFL